YGTRNSRKVDFLGSDVWAGLGAAVDGSVFNNDGFPIVAANERGPVDNNASVDFRNINVKLDYHPTARVSAFLRGGYFREKRNNGKASTVNGVEEANDTRWTSGSGGARVLLPDESSLPATPFTAVDTSHRT